MGFFAKAAKDKRDRKKSYIHLKVKSNQNENADLRARLRELNCFHGIYRLAENIISLEEFFQEAVEHIRQAYRHPESIAVRILFDHIEAKTKKFRETLWRQGHGILVSGIRQGWVEIHCLEEEAAVAEGFFLQDKKDFIRVLAADLGNIIHRHRSEAELRQALHRAESEKSIAEAIIAGIGDGISIQDTSCRILYQNQRHIDLMGEHVDEYCYTAYEDKDSVCEGCPLVKSFHDGKSHTIERIIKTHKGSRHFEITSSPLRNSAGTIVSGIEIVKDVTERRRQTQEDFKEYNLEALGTLAGGLAHDYNNLLTSVHGNIELAKMRVANKDGETYKLLNSASNASKKAQFLTRQLLTFAKGGAPIKKRASIVDELLKAGDHALKDSPVKCEYEIDGGLWEVEIDKRQTGLVFHNIILNAKEAMPAGGKILIKAENVTIDETDNQPPGRGKYVVISFADEGRGIEKKNLPRIFDPYFTTKSFGLVRGTGLGLAICHSVVKKHGGHIRVESEPGKGALFRIYLPAVDDPWR